MECTWHPSIPLLASWDPFFFRLDRVRSPGERRWLAVKLRLTPVGCSGEGDSSVESSPPPHARMQPEQQGKPSALPLQAAVKGVGAQPSHTQPSKVQPNKPPAAAPAAPPQTAAAGTCFSRHSRHNLITALLIFLDTPIIQLLPHPQVHRRRRNSRLLSAPQVGVPIRGSSSALLQSSAGRRRRERLRKLRRSLRSRRESMRVGALAGKGRHRRRRGAWRKSS